MQSAGVHQAQLESIVQERLEQWLMDLLGKVPTDLPSFHIQMFEQVDSTNAVVWQLWQQGTGEGTVAIAQRQQAGRGQRGRSWHSPEGGLYLSLGLQPSQPAQTAAGLTLGCAWGIATALRQSRIPVGIKWPNDLMLERRKLGGILTETRLHQNQIQAAVVGIGINWRNEVPDLGIALNPYLQKQGQGDEAIATLETLAARVLAGAWAGYWRWITGDLDSLVTDYEALLVNLGQSVNIGGNLGTIVGVTSQGHLRVQCPGTDAVPQESHLAVGEVQLGYDTLQMPDASASPRN